MFIHPLKTRHTALGTFRRGVIYTVDPKGKNFNKSIKPQLKSKDNPDGPFEELTEAQVKKRNAEVQPLLEEAKSAAGKSKG